MPEKKECRNCGHSAVSNEAAPFFRCERCRLLQPRKGVSLDALAKQVGSRIVSQCEAEQSYKDRNKLRPN